MHELKEELNIENMIYEIRWKQVMLDSDLAKLYQCKNGTKEINQAVKNNPDKFPERYSFQLSDNEYNNLRSKFLTSSLENGYGCRRYNPYRFSECFFVLFVWKESEKILVENFDPKYKNVKICEKSVKL